VGYAYPPSLPVDCLTDIVNLIRSRQVAAEKAKFFNCVWTVQGYAQKLGFGDPDSEERFGAAPLEDADCNQLDDCQVALLTYKREVSDEPQTFAAAEGETAIDPLTVLAIIEMAMKIIVFIRERRKS
jgi:hypothetical protein